MPVDGLVRRFQSPIYSLANVVRPAIEFDLSRFDPCHLSGLFDQVIHPVGLFIDDCEQFVLLRTVETSGEQTRRGSFDRREWGTELVCDGVEDGGTQFLVFTRGLSLAHLLYGASALNRNSHQRRESIQAFVRQSCTGDSN